MVHFSGVWKTGCHRRKSAKADLYKLGQQRAWRKIEDKALTSRGKALSLFTVKDAGEVLVTGEVMKGACKRSKGVKKKRNKTGSEK